MVTSDRTPGGPSMFEANAADLADSRYSFRCKRGICHFERGETVCHWFEAAQPHERLTEHGVDDGVEKKGVGSGRSPRIKVTVSLSIVLSRPQLASQRGHMCRATRGFTGVFRDQV